MKGKLIVIEGTDCSGKETQSNLLLEFLNKNGLTTKKYSFPNYNSPTGKIIAGPLLGKQGHLPPLFKEGATNVDPYCASLLYAMDRKYNIQPIIDELNNGINVLLDRYIDSNTAHQGSKLNGQEQEHMFYFIEQLEYELLKLPRPDIKILLHMPTWASVKLREGRPEPPDQSESDINHLQKSEETYLKIANRNNYSIIKCTKNEQILDIKEINNILCKLVYDKLHD